MILSEKMPQNGHGVREHFGADQRQKGSECRAGEKILNNKAGTCKRAGVVAPGKNNTN